MSATASVRRARQSIKGFTLVEILIVVIILGILAAIVIPQFTSASDDARKNSLTSQVQTLRSQIELYKLQHTSDSSELYGSATAMWDHLTKTTNAAGATPVAGDKVFGPYLQTVPVNNINGKSTIKESTTVQESDYTTDANGVSNGSVIDATAGFAYNTTTGKFFGLDKDGRLYLGN